MGFVITLISQLLFIPTFRYMACAWAAFFSNLVMMIVSYFLGQKHYPIPYNLKTASLFTIIALVLFAGMQLTHAYIDNVWLRLCINTIFVVAYAIILIRKELPLHDIPVIGKYFKSK